MTYSLDNGVYIDGVLKADHLSVEYNTAELGKVGKNSGMAYTASAEVGYRTNFGADYFIDSSLQVAAIRQKLDSFTDQSEIEVSGNAETIAIGRIGTRIGKSINTGSSVFKPYVRTGLQTSNGGKSMNFSGVDLERAKLGSSWTLGGGLDAKIGKASSISVDLGYRGKLGSNGASGAEASAVFKMDF